MRRQSTLTLEDARDIRAQYAAGGCSQQSIAIWYGVSQRLISGIVRLEYLTADTVSCEVCGSVFEPNGSTHKLCAPCGKDRVVFKVFLRSILGIAARAAERAKTLSDRKCAHCGEPVSTKRSSRAAYCTDRCSEAAHNATRKASWKIGEHQEVVSRAYIIERDAGRCHLCGKKCRAEEIHLDHLVPLSRGGTHAAENLRVACATCNLSKRADARNEQLMAFG